MDHDSGAQRIDNQRKGEKWKGMEWGGEWVGDTNASFGLFLDAVLLWHIKG